MQAEQNLQDLRFQFKNAGYETPTVKLQLKDVETAISPSVIQRCPNPESQNNNEPSYIPPYEVLAFDRALEIAGRRANEKPDIDNCPLKRWMVSDINNDYDNTIYGIPYKREGQRFENVIDFLNFLHNQVYYIGDNIGMDLERAGGFSEGLMTVKEVLSKALREVLFPNNTTYIFNVRREGFDLAQEIMPNIEKDVDYTVRKGGMGATTKVKYKDGYMNIITMGKGAGNKQEVHEVGHVLENRMVVEDFLKVHRFLRARSREDTDIEDTGYKWEYNNWKLPMLYSYNAYLPELKIYEDRYRKEPDSSLSAAIWDRVIGGQRKLDRLLAQSSNSEKTRYATSYNKEDYYKTEFISTTAELFASKTNVQYLIKHDPFRAAFFLYMANRGLYNAVSDKYTIQARRENVNTDLNRIIHVN